MTLAALFRMIEASAPTILLDEIDRFIGGHIDDRKQEMIGLLDGTFRRGDTVVRVVGEGTAMTVQDFHLYTPWRWPGSAGCPTRCNTDRSS